MDAAHQIRKSCIPITRLPGSSTGNVNTTNVCIAGIASFATLPIPGHADAYITTIDQYKEKIEETLRYGGEQPCCRWTSPGLGLQFYIDTFRELKRLYPNLKLACPAS